MNTYIYIYVYSPGKQRPLKSAYRHPYNPATPCYTWRNHVVELPENTQFLTLFTGAEMA